MNDKFPSDKQDKFMLRLPDGMRDRIAQAAKSNGRSMNAEIVGRLGGSFSETNDAARKKQELAYADLGVAAPLLILAMALEGKIPKDSELITAVMERAKKDAVKYVMAANTLEDVPKTAPPPAHKKPRARRG